MVYDNDASSGELETAQEKKKYFGFSRLSFWLIFIFIFCPLIFSSFSMFSRIYNAHNKSSKVKLALENFKIEYHHYPETLQQLMPKFLKEIPEGIFDYSFDKEKETYIFLFVQRGLILFPDETWYRGGGISQKKVVE